MVKRSYPSEEGRIHPLQATAFAGDAKQFVRSPGTFASKLGISIESLACPPEVHTALKRGEALATAVKKSSVELSKAGVQELGKMAAEHFGRDYEVSFIPFGLQFRERIKIDSSLGITATGTASITWADTDADVDG